MITAKVVDDLIVCGDIPTMKEFYSNVSSRFNLGRFLCDVPFEFFSLLIKQAKDGSISISVLNYLDKTSAIPITKQQKCTPDEICPPEFHSHVRKLAGELNFFGTGSTPSRGICCILGTAAARTPEILSCDPD